MHRTIKNNNDMTTKEIKQKAREYIDIQLSENPDWLDCITDSWIHDAEDWFTTYLDEKGIVIYNEDDSLTPEGDKILDIFWGESFKYKKEKNIEINGVRDGLGYLNGCLYDIKQLQVKLAKAYELITPHVIGECSLETPPKVSLSYFTIPENDLNSARRDIKILMKKIESVAEIGKTEVKQ